MSLDFKGLWNLKDSRVYVLLSGVVLLVCVSLGSIPVGKDVLPIKDPMLFSVVGVALVVAGVLGILFVPIGPVQENAAKGKLTFGLKEVLGQSAKPLEIDYKDLTTVDALLDNIYDRIRSAVSAGSYGEQWIIRRENGEPFHILGTVWAQLFNEAYDNRGPGEVGMEPGMKFEVKRHKQPLLLINLDPKLGKKAEIKPVRYEDMHELDDFLNTIGASVLPTQSSSTYGDKWVLRDVASGKTLNDIGPAWARRNKEPRDGRSLAEAGMTKNMRLHVVFKTPQSNPIDTAPAMVELFKFRPWEKFLYRNLPLARLVRRRTRNPVQRRECERWGMLWAE
jgi:hypothetical protein